MASCVELHRLTISNVGSNAVYIKVDGVTVGAGIDSFVPSSTQTDVNCTAYIVETAADYALSHPQLTFEETASLSMSVVGCWVLAWGFKVLRRAL